MTSARASWRLAVSLILLGRGLTAPDAFAIEPASFKAGPLNIAPTLDAELRYVENLLRTTDGSISSWGTLLEPRLQTWLQDGFNTYSLTYGIADTTYFDSTDDNATDHKVDLDIHQEFNARNALNLSLKYYQLHEERGTGLAEGDIALLIDKPVEFDHQSIGGQYTYGNQKSKGRLVLESNFTELEYQNFRAVSAFHDRDTFDLRGSFHYRTGSRTEAIFELGLVEQEYKISAQETDQNFAGLDSTETYALVGADWAATAKTTATVKVGGFERDYEGSARNDDQGFHWEAEVTYKPRSYSTMHFSTRRVSRETNGQGAYVDSAQYRVDWRHRWGNRILSSIYARYADEGYVGSARDDEVYRFGAKAEYSLRRWVDLDFGYRYEKRSSNAPSLTYDRDVFFIGVKLSL